MSIVVIVLLLNTFTRLLLRSKTPKHQRVLVEQKNSASTEIAVQREQPREYTSYKPLESGYVFRKDCFSQPFQRSSYVNVRYVKLVCNDSYPLGEVELGKLCSKSQEKAFFRGPFVTEFGDPPYRLDPHPWHSFVKESQFIHPLHRGHVGMVVVLLRRHVATHGSL